MDARPHGHECVDLRWATPRAALDAYARGGLPLAFPTLRHLEQLSAFDTAPALLEHARTHDVLPVRPRIVRSGGVARLVL